MKKYILIFLLTGLSLVLPTSCLKEYLDKAPEQGLTDEQVFSKYDNFKLYFDAVYEGRKMFSGGWYDYNIKTAHPLYFTFWDQKITWEGFTEAADQGRYQTAQTFKQGGVPWIGMFTYDGKRRPVLESMFTDIRICNTALKNMHYLEDNKVNPIEVADLKGQAYFIRAYCHFTLFKLWGPMPYITNVIGPYDQWDIPRLSKHETAVKIAADFDSAYYYFNLAGRVRRDNPIPGAPGHLTSPDQKRPNGAAAKAFKGRALLYAASPENNELGITDWQNAAIANWDALQVAIANGYALQVSLLERKKNFCGADYTNEDLWAWTAGSTSWNNGNLAGIMPSMFISTSSTHSGVCPTQNFVDKYETLDGDALNTQKERDDANAIGHYYEQDPYKNRDPRLAADIITNQSSFPGWLNNKAQIYYSISGSTVTYSELLQFNVFKGVTYTGYYCRKYNWNNSSKGTTSASILSDPLCRLAEVYLSYAEAANEAYGPNTAAPGASMTAVDAVNIVRARVGMPPVLAAYTTDKDVFRLRIKNERNVELAWEGHYYFDIRRWKDAPAAYAGPMIGMDIEKLPAGYDPAVYPTGFRYLRKPIPADRQSSWKDPMYYLPFDAEDNFKMKNFVPNIVW